MDATIRGEEGERSRNPERGAGSAMTARDPLHEDPLRPELPALFSRLGALRPPAARASSLPSPPRLPAPRGRRWPTEAVDNGG